MGIDWGYWLGQSVWTLCLGISGAALFEWVVRPLYLRAFGSESQRKRSAERHERIFADAAKYGAVGAFLRMATLMVGIPACLAVAFAAATLTGIAVPKEHFVEWRPAVRILANLSAPLLAGMICYLTLRMLVEVHGVIATCRSFENSVAFLEPVATRKEILELRSDFVAMRNRHDAKEINSRLLAIAERSNKPIPWVDEFYQETS